VLTLEPWQVVGISVLVAVGAGAAYWSRKGNTGPELKTRSKSSAHDVQEAARTQQRADQVARLTPPSEAKVGPSAGAEISNEQLIRRALDLSSQVRMLALTWAGQTDQDLAKAFNAEESGERRAPDRLAEARHDRARTLYQRIRHDVIDVRTELVSRLGGPTVASRKPGIDRMYDYQGGVEPFQDIADDLELLATSLGGK
jgi:hypothetical protein